MSDTTNRISRIVLILLAALIFVVGCSNQVNNNEQQKITGQNLKKLVEDALWGSSNANNQLSGLANANMPSPDKFNYIIIDSATAQSGTKLFSVLLENPNPLYNILAVYDEHLNLLLLDNSLNGNLVSKWETLSGRLYLVASENFVSKDILELSRLSLYTLIDNKIYPVFRSFTKLVKAGKIYLQSIENISDTRIVTRIASNISFKLNNTKDNFDYNSSDHKYISNKSSFDKFILNEIKTADWPIEKPELKSETGDKTVHEEKTETQQPNETVAVNTKGFKISLNSDWNKPISIAVTEHLISKLEGIRYINQKIGAQFTVIKLPDGSNASQFVSYKFGKPTKGEYRVRSTDLIESGNNYLQFYEHSCSNKTYLLLLETPKHSYEKNKSNFENIITSFFVEC